jgi:putative spermidine/putrescine transport system permease protein
MAITTSRLRSTTKSGHSWIAWLGLVPLFLFGLSFEFLPILTTIRSSFTTEGRLTLEFYRQAMDPLFLRSFINTFKISAATASLGVVFGTLVAYAIITTRNKFLQNALTALSDVTTNFGGAPLAFAFIIILGSTGIITLLLKEVGIQLYPHFRIYSASGLTIAYLYFQLPLMILLIIPSLHGLKREWHEAALNLGASTFQYWVRVALPILFPSLASGFLLLFANSFGAYATAWTLTGSDVDLITIRIAALIRGEVQLAPELADALSIISLLIMIACVMGYTWLMIVPVIATFMFSISTRWDRTLWPEGFTLDWWKAVTSHAAFGLTLKNSFLASFATMLCLLVLVTPTTYWMKLRVPQSKPFVELLTTFSFGVPGVVLALALIRFYSKIPLPIINHPAILIAACMVLSLPFMYRPVLNSLEAIDFRVLTEAAQSLGANGWDILVRVIVPNIMPGILSGCLLVFSTVFSEFTLTNLLVGTRFKTFPIYLVEFTRQDGRQASALAVISFVVAWVTSLLIIWVTSKGGQETTHISRQ